MVKGQKYHILYRTTCTVTGNFYIGVHSTTNLEDGYLGSGKRLGYSIKKHGKENHVREILEFFETREDLMNREREIVNDDLLNEEKCMNLKKGGDGGFIDQEHLNKMHKGVSEWLKRKWKDEDFSNTQKERLRDNNRKNHASGKIKAPDWTGKKHKKETLEKFSKARKGTGRGEKNSQYGKIWIFNESEKRNLSLSKTEAELFLMNGWKKGRKTF